MVYSMTASTEEIGHNAEKIITWPNRQKIGQQTKRVRNPPRHWLMNCELSPKESHFCLKNSQLLQKQSAVSRFLKCDWDLRL